MSKFLFDHVIKKKLNVIVDGTLRSLTSAEKNIERALTKGRFVSLTYIYQDPVLAWEFTKKREATEGRKITVDDFIECFFAAKDNVDKLKTKYQDNLRVDLVTKNFSNYIERVEMNISKVDNYLKVSYSAQALRGTLK